MAETRTTASSLHTVLALTIAAASLTLAACGGGAKPDALPTIAFEKYTLPNGLEVILSEDHRLPLVSVDVWYHVGPANEAAGRTGFAHLFEHMMFQGSKHVPGDSHFQLLEAAGGTNLNGTTNFDRTNYFETLPANQLELGLWLESDRMGYLLDTLDEEKLANQQDVVRNERREGENAPYTLVQEKLIQAVFPKGHPYYGNVIGSHADIQAARLDDVKAFFKQYYAPNNASLAIVGDVDSAKVKTLVEKYFGPLKRGPAIPDLNVTTPPITEERRLTVQDRVPLPRVYMAWITPAFFTPGDADADATSDILAGGHSSRLYRALVYDKQIAQDVTAFQQSLALGSVFQIIATARPGHTPEELETAINDVLDGLRARAPEASEVERARNTFETGFISGLQVMGGFGGVADTLNMFNHYVKDPGYLPRYLDDHRKVTPDTVKAFVTTYLQPTKRVVVFGVPGTPDYGPDVPTPPMPKVAPGTGAESVNEDAAWRATPPPPAPEHPITLPTPVTFTLDNGLTVVLNERPGLPVVAADLVVRSGGGANPPDRPGLASFTAAMLDQGTATRNALQIADAVGQIGATLNASSSKDATTVSVESLVRNFPAAIALLADVALHPSFPAEEVERQRASRTATLLQYRQDPGTIAQVTALAALYGLAHPYGYVELGRDASVRAMPREALVDFWKQSFTPGNAALVVAGAISEADLKAIAEEQFGAWKGAAPAPRDLPAPPAPGARVAIVDVPGAPQTQILFGGIGAPRSTPDYAAANVMNAVLGGLFSSRINLNLREAHGYTYGAFSQFLFRRSSGPFWILSGVRTDVTAPAIAEVEKEIRRMAAAPMTDAELRMAKDSMVHALPSAFETSASAAGSLADLYVYDLGWDYFARYPSEVGGVTTADALAAAKKYLVPDRMVIVAVGDRAKIESGIRALKLGTIEIRNPDGTKK